MSKKLPMLCSQLYIGSISMRVTGCTQCNNWDVRDKRCTVPSGAEALPWVVEVPSCPIEDRCQHQVQELPLPCAVRRAGMICESALIFSGMDVADATEHKLAFNASLLE